MQQGLGMPPREPALKLIIAYKLVRSLAALLAGVTFLALVPTQFDVSLREVASRLNLLTAEVAELLRWAAEPRHLAAVGVLLTVDGLITFVEGWALWRGWPWAAWLVVIASGLLLPFEVAALVDQVTVLRVSALAINGAIVTWLLRARLLRPAPEIELEGSPKVGSDAPPSPTSLA